MRLLLQILIFALTATGAVAQSSPNFSYGQVPTAGQWNAAFATKQDVLTFVPLNRAGGTMMGKLSTYPSTINNAGFAILPGVAPTNPGNGDLWVVGGGLFARLGNQTTGIAPLISPTFTGTVTIPTLAITGSGSTGDVSGMSVLATGSTVSRSLAARASDITSMSDYSSLTTALAAAGPRLMIDPVGGRIRMRVASSPTFDESSGTLGRGLIFDSAGVYPAPAGSPGMVMPTGKQFDYMGWRDTIQQNGSSKASWLDFDLTINGGQGDSTVNGTLVPGSNAYAGIGNLTNNGPGTVAAWYGRTTIGADNTGGNAIAFKGGVTNRVGSGTTMGFQMSVDNMPPTAGGSQKPVDYGYMLDTNDYGGYGYGQVNYGFITRQNVQVQQALIQGFAGGTGDALRWVTADGSTYLAKINKDGSALLQGLTIGTGGMALSSTSITLPVQGTVSWSNSSRLWQGQAVSTGDRWRLIAGNIGDMLSIDVNGNLGIGGTPTIAPQSGTNVPLTLKGLGTSGVLTSAFIRSSDPTTIDIPSGQCADWNNTTNATFRHVCNFGGTLRSVTMN